jgi:hypothetical protein
VTQSFCLLYTRTCAQTGPTPHYATTAEAKDAFKGLLLDAGVASGMSWDESMRLIVQDRR